MANGLVAAVEEALAAFIEPGLGRDLVAGGWVASVQDDAGRVAIDVRLDFPARRFQSELRERLRAVIAAVPGVNEVEINIDDARPTAPPPGDASALEGVRHIIAVSSGKGGVGKSTTAVNLALALADEGARVGMLDADIYGPSLPRMLAITGRPTSHDGKRFEPLTGYGLQAMSAGFLIDEEEPMVWRGSMVTQALEQLMRDTVWKDLDYLVVDMPPGTGDVQLTLAQRVKVSGAVVVTTPQDIALLDATRGLNMFTKVGVPVLGVIENMATHHCSQCGHEEPVFGEGGGERLAQRHELELLGSLPLDVRIREQADQGAPTVVSEPDGEVAQAYRTIARGMAARLALRSRDTATGGPRISIQED